MEQFLPGFWTNFWAGLASGIILVALGRAVFLSQRIVRRFLRLHRQFTISGTWVGVCILPNYPANVEAIEIYRFHMIVDRVDLKFFNYRPDVSEIRQHEGAGVFRGKRLSAFYYTPTSESFESGVFVVNLAGSELRGFYAQYTGTTAEELIVSPETFSLVRVHLSRLAAMRMRFGLPPYRSYDEAKRVYSAVHSDVKLDPR